MIVGVVLRHYKNYENVNFLPISNSFDCKYTVYVGNNGVGKSGILESIDVVLNDREWNLTLGQKKDKAYICPIFLIPKNEGNPMKDIYKFIGDYFWHSQNDINPNLRLWPWNDFFIFRDSLKEKYYNSHDLVVIGSKYDNNKDAYFSTFNKDLYEKFSEQFSLSTDKSKEILEEIREDIYGRYSYLYIPVEQPLNEMLRLETNQMQMLLNKDLLNEIEKILTRKDERYGNKPIVKQINEYLDNFIDGVNTAIATVDDNYSFTTESNYKKNLTAKDIREKILEAYFSLKTLKRNDKRISQLSSGEQRKALIDVAYSIVVTNGMQDTEKEVILAIDEPETSMHVSNCFNQFIMLESLAKKYNKQVILTTHWYGFLPITQSGNMHYISREGENKVNVNSFDFYNYLEDRRRYPDVIELKSMFDLATSILTYMRSNPDIRWIVCEGSDDKIYLECMFKEDQRVRVLAVGGCGNVVKLYQLLYSPMTEKEESKSIESKILFLIDTDLKFKQVEKPIMLSGDKKRSIVIRRLQIQDGKIEIFDPTKINTYEQTEIEDCLIPELYYESLIEAIGNKGTVEEKDVMNNFKFIVGASNSRLIGDDACIIAKESNYIPKKRVILEFAQDNNNKYIIAQNYVKKYNGEEHELRIKLAECLGI